MSGEDIIKAGLKEKTSRRRFILTVLVVTPVAAFSAYWLLQGKASPTTTTTTSASTSPISTSTPPTSSTTSTASITATTETTPITTTTSTTPVTTTTETTPIDPKLKEKFIELLPKACSFKPVSKDGEIVYYEAYDERGALIGYTFIAEAAAPTDKLLVTGAIDLDYKVIAVDVEATSTTVWKKEICESEFEEQFVGRGVDDLSLTKEGGKIDGVTGATMSSKAVIEAIKEKIMEIENIASSHS